MSDNNVTNGPVDNSGQGAQDMTKYHPNGNGTGPPTAFPPRPPLTRIDSRSQFQYRPGFPPNQPIPSARPQLIRPNVPPAGLIQQNPQFRTPAPGARPPGQPPFPQNQGPPPVRPNVNPNLRPATPYPRPQQGPPVRPPLTQQKSVPTLSQQGAPPHFEYLERSQTLDSSDSNAFKSPEDERIAQVENRAHLASATNRNYVQNSQPYDHTATEERRQSVTSIGSNDGRRSISGSVENIDRKSENEYPSRPESRSSSRMSKIDEYNYSKNQSPSNFEKDLDSKNPTKSENQTPITKADSQNKLSASRESLVDKNKNSPNRSPVASKKSAEEKKEDPVSNQNGSDTARTKSPAPAKTPVKESKPAVKRNDSKPEVNNLTLKNTSQMKLSKKDGDNDSGVDESTQGNDQSSNGDHSSPRKSASKTRSAVMTPTKNRSLSRGSKSPSLKSPDSNATTPGSVEKKKLPMNKIQVGSAPSPNLKVVKSKIGSLENASYKPGGGNVKIESKKLDFKKAAPRIEAKNDKYTPKGGEKKIQQQKLQWNAKSKIGSLENATHKPKGGDKKIETVKLDFKERAKPKVGSKDNIKHVPGGGDVKSQGEKKEEHKDIENKKIELNVQSKVGSLDNVKHKPGGGDKKIFDDKEYLKQKSAMTSENHSLCGSQNSLPSQQEVRGPTADENLNQER